MKNYDNNHQNTPIMKKAGLYFFLIAIMMAAIACSDDSTEDISDISAEMDKRFLLNASDRSLFEVNAGQVALSKGASATIKDYGKSMLNDYTDINQELQTLARQNNVSITNTLSSEMQQRLDTLSGLSGIALDSVYARIMVTTHSETVQLYETQATIGRSVDIKTWASDKLVQLRHHLETARALKDTVQ